MATKVTFARYGLLMGGQSLESEIKGTGKSVSGYFRGSLFEVRQKRPLPIGGGLFHYPVALLNPDKMRIRCEICLFQVEEVDLFWLNLFKAEMYYPYLSSEKSLMLPSHTRVFSDAGDTYYVPIFVFNPLFYMFWRGKFGMDVREVAPDENGFVSWKNIKPWFPV